MLLTNFVHLSVNHNLALIEEQDLVKDGFHILNQVGGDEDGGGFVKVFEDGVQDILLLGLADAYTS